MLLTFSKICCKIHAFIEHVVILSVSYNDNHDRSDPAHACR